MATIINASNTTGLTMTSDLSGVLQLQQNGANTISFPSTTGTVLTKNASGYATNNTQAYAYVTPPISYSISAGADTTIGGTWAVVSNIGGNFNTSGGVFTAPVTGVYSIVWSAFFSASAATRLDVYILVNGTVKARSEQQKWGSSNANNGCQVSAILPLNANDTVTFGVYSSSATTLHNAAIPWQYACIYLLG